MLRCTNTVMILIFLVGVLTGSFLMTIAAPNEPVKEVTTLSVPSKPELVELYRYGFQEGLGEVMEGWLLSMVNIAPEEGREQYAAGRESGRQIGRQLSFGRDTDSELRHAFERRLNQLLWNRRSAVVGHETLSQLVLENPTAAPSSLADLEEFRTKIESLDQVLKSAADKMPDWSVMKSGIEQ